MNSQGYVLNVQGLGKTFVQGERRLIIFRDLSFSVAEGEIVALVGNSGSGKSTLLQLAGLLDTPTHGHVWIDGCQASLLNDAKRTALRSGDVGFIYQFHHLLPEFSAVENVAMGAIIAGCPRKEAHQAAERNLRELGLGGRLTHRPGQLSGGEQQRVAIARALVNSPRLILADEPTGNLDPETSEDVFQILLDQVRRRGMGAVIATHNHELAYKMDRVLVLNGGCLSEITKEDVT